MIIEITKEHIRKAKKLCKTNSRNTNCPIALALNETTNRLDWHVSYYYYLNYSSPEGVAFKTSVRAQRFIQRFDLGKPVKPCRFKIKGL